jgi:spore germination cell wall hydrolase CwlJ-like protein
MRVPRRALFAIFVLMMPLVAAANEPYGPMADNELDCIARAVYFEAGGEPLAGQIAVAQVIMNRVKDRRFADTPCGVIADGFFFPRDVPITMAARWELAQRIATDVANGRNLDERLLHALYFHGVNEHPSWMRIKHRVATIGHHIFYRD